MSEQTDTQTDTTRTDAQTEQAEQAGGPLSHTTPAEAITEITIALGMETRPADESQHGVVEVTRRVITMQREGREVLDQLRRMLDLPAGSRAPELVDVVGDLLDLRGWLEGIRADVAQALPMLPSDIGLSAVRGRIGELANNRNAYREEASAYERAIDQIRRGLGLRESASLEVVLAQFERSRAAAGTAADTAVAGTVDANSAAAALARCYRASLAPVDLDELTEAEMDAAVATNPLAVATRVEQAFGSLRTSADQAKSDPTSRTDMEGHLVDALARVYSQVVGASPEASVLAVRRSPTQARRTVEDRLDVGSPVNWKVVHDQVRAAVIRSIPERPETVAHMSTLLLVDKLVATVVEQAHAAGRGDLLAEQAEAAATGGVEQESVGAYDLGALMALVLAAAELDPTSGGTTLRPYDRPAAGHTWDAQVRAALQVVAQAADRVQALIPAVS